MGRNVSVAANEIPADRRHIYFAQRLPEPNGILYRLLTAPRVTLHYILPTRRNSYGRRQCLIFLESIVTFPKCILEIAPLGDKIAAANATRMIRIFRGKLVTISHQ